MTCQLPKLQLIPFLRPVILTAIVCAWVSGGQSHAQQPPTKTDASKSQQESTQVADLPDKSAAPASKPNNGISFGNEVKFKWKVGVKIASAGNFNNVLVTIPVPVEWPEQSIELLEENVPVQIGKIKYREIDSDVRQIVTKVDTIPARTLFEFDLTFLVTVREIKPPPDTSIFQIPTPSPRELKPYLGVGPEINYRNGKIRSTVKGIVGDIEGGWAQTEAIYNWVRENIELKDGKNKDSVSTIRDGEGNSEDQVGLFVAMCRANKTPARVVWVDGHLYAEFYLWDQEKQGHWIPCNVAGIREFGSYSDPRVIQQKGDNVKVPEHKERQKFVFEFVDGSGKSRPKVLFIREMTPVD